MFRKNYFTFLLAIALFSVGGTAAFAQTAPVSGKILVKKGDVLEPVAGATVEVYRATSKSKLLSDKTDKKGNFAFAGLALGDKYLFSISGPGIAPYIYPNVSPGMDNVSITVYEGDGKKFTYEEIQQAVAAAKNKTSTNTNNTNNTNNTTTPTTDAAKTDTKTDTEQPAELTAEQKKQQAEEQKRIAEIENKNKTIGERNTQRDAAVKAGKAAMDVKDYDTAIARFDEGYKVDTEFIGSAPFFLIAKGKALSNRGVERYNKANKLTDSAKTEAMNTVMKDFSDAVDAFNTSFTMLKTASPTGVADPKRLETDKLEALYAGQNHELTIEVPAGLFDAAALAATKNLVGYMIATEKIDTAKLPLIKTLMTEYMNVETDAAMKAKAQISLADMYRIAGDSDNAIIEYRKALEMAPDNPDALAGLGLSLFNSGEINNNVAQKQEGLGFMERFTAVAPDGHKLKASVADAVTYLKSQKITPQKVTTTTKKKN